MRYAARQGELAEALLSEALEFPCPGAEGVSIRCEWMNYETTIEVLVCVPGAGRVPVSATIVGEGHAIVRTRKCAADMAAKAVCRMLAALESPAGA